MGVVELFARSSSTLVFDDDRTARAADLAHGAGRDADRLRSAGIAPGDRLAVRLPNSLAYVRVLLAAAELGAVVVSVNTRYSPAEVDDLVERSGARLLTGVDELLGSPTAASEAGRGATDDHTDQPYVVFTTSGTTSKPKMVLHRQRSIGEHAADVAAGFAYRADDVVLVTMPLCGTFGLASLMGAVAGSGRVLVTDYDTERVAETIAAERVTCVNGSDDMFHRLLEHGAGLSSIRLGGYARFNTSLDGIVDRAASADATLVGLYGMSEVQALFAVRDPGAPVRERERAGGRLVSPLASYRVVDGELQLRGPSLFAGYLAEGGEEIDVELTARHYDDGWFRTGDLAAADDERAFEYVARMGDALRIGGFLVSPSEIEAVLVDLSGIEAAQVVAVDRPGGARPVAFVVTNGGEVDELSVIEHCGTRLARYKVPIRVVAVDEFPSTPSANGTKIKKSELRALAERLIG